MNAEGERGGGPGKKKRRWINGKAPRTRERETVMQMISESSSSSSETMPAFISTRPRSHARDLDRFEGAEQDAINVSACRTNKHAINPPHRCLGIQHYSGIFSGTFSATTFDQSAPNPSKMSAQWIGGGRRTQTRGKRKTPLHNQH